VSALPAQLVDGLWRWTARHPEWHPGEFGAEVAAFAVRADGVTLLIDPLLPEGGTRAAVLEALDAIVDGPAAILVTIPYHARSSEELAARYRATIHGHPATAKRLEDASAFRVAEPGAPLPGGARAFAIGRPRRFERPMWLPSQRAVVFGDAVVETGGELRVWAQSAVDEGRRRFHRERFNPTLEPLVALDPRRVLVTHGEPVLEGGRAALAAALVAEPFWHHG
jgi:glyoxylase-like metal-dependent hydrolase (beta-lactamase superfamily II)